MNISDDLHIFFLPFLAPGHMIPMVDMATAFSARGVKSTIITTVGNASRIQPSIDLSPHPVNLLTLSFPSSVQENVTTLNTPDIVNPEFVAGLDSLEAPFQRLVADHRPDCIISDILYPWSADVAARRGIPRIDFSGSSLISYVNHTAIGKFRPQDGVSGDDDPFVVPGTGVEMRRSQLMSAAPAHVIELLARSTKAREISYGMIMNTFRDMEPPYAGGSADRKSWLVGPLCLANRNVPARPVRGGEDFLDCSSWLDRRAPGSVLYACFGSVGRFTSPQLREIGSGLRSAGHPFVWVVKCDGDGSDWTAEGGDGEEGLIVTGWAPQMEILSHSSVGGFLTHCGWNSCLEGASAGLPMVTWPMYADQFLNEKLLVDVLRIGVGVGSKVSTDAKEKRSWIGREKVREAVEEVMGRGEEAEKRRKRAKEVAEAAARAVEEGGSSYNDLSKLIMELREIKARNTVATVG